MELDPKMKFVCKVCNKRYPCGKSLGGHLRSHNRIVNSAQQEEKAQANTVKVFFLNGGRNSKRDSGSDAGGQSGYGLRENPKRTRRFVDSSTISLQEKFCKECGKRFLTLKALCGHMACHSEKEKGINKFEDDSGSSEKQKLVKDSQSDTETSNPGLRRSMRYKALDVYSSSFSLANGSSSVSEIEQEQEEVAMCLMMLSRDSGYKKGFNSVAESSDNNSVILEAKSSSIDMRITIKNGLNCASNVNELVGMKKKPARERKLNSAEIDLSDNSDSGYFRNGPKKVDSDVSVYGFGRNDDFKKLKEENGSEFEDIDAELGKSLSRYKRTKPELGKNLTYDQVDTTVMKCNLRKTAKIGFNSPDIRMVGCKKITNGSASVKVCKSARKRSLTCNKSFPAHRALQGHITNHRRIDGCFGSRYESGENSLATDSFPIPTPDNKLIKPCTGKTPIAQDFSGNAEKRLGFKKSKRHECPICFRVFRSGQALGGHKRSHFLGGSEDRTIVIEQELPETPALLDLNLPAPIDDEANEDSLFMPW